MMQYKCVAIILYIYDANANYKCDANYMYDAITLYIYIILNIFYSVCTLF